MSGSEHKVKSHLRMLVRAVEQYLVWLDREMHWPPTADRGSRIAAAANDLEIAKDIAKRYGVAPRQHQKRKRNASKETPEGAAGGGRSTAAKDGSSRD